MDEVRRKEVREVFDKLGHMHREPWTHRGTSTADPVPLSTWGEFSDKRYDFITDVIVIGLENPGALHELIQYTRGELRGAALELRRVAIPQIVFVKHILDALGEGRLQRGVCAHKIAAYAPDSGYSRDAIEGLAYFGIYVIPDRNRLVSECSLVLDLRAEQWSSLNSRDLASFTGSFWHYYTLTPPGAILKRSCAMELPFGSLVSSVASDYEVVTHFELPSYVTPMHETEKAWFHSLRSRFRLDTADDPRRWKTNTQQNGDQSEAAKQFSLLYEDEQRLTQLARNMMALVVRKGR